MAEAYTPKEGYDKISKKEKIKKMQVF